MARAFHRVLAGHFHLWCGGASIGSESYCRSDLPVRGSQAWRYLGACVQSALCVLGNRSATVYTRDVAVAFTAVLFGGRSVYEAHKEMKGWLVDWLMRRLARSGRFGIVAISQALASYYGNVYSIATGRMLVAHSGAWPDEYRELRLYGKRDLRRKLGLPEEGILVVHTGSLYKGRGAELFELVIGNRPDLLFVQVGGEPDDIAYWKDHYASLGISNIVFVERQPAGRVRQYQVAADLLFYMITKDTSTYWCCSPLKLFEYMASGTPILAACIGSVSEVLDESSAYCFDPERPETIISAFDRFLTDGGASARASRALSMAEQSYSWAQRARSVIRFCRVTPSSLKQEIPS